MDSTRNRPDPNKTHQYMLNTRDVGQYEQLGKAHLMEFRDGKVQKKQGIGSLAAKISHKLYTVSDFTFKTSFVKSEKNKTINNVYRQNVAFYQDPTKRASIHIDTAYKWSRKEKDLISRAATAYIGSGGSFKELIGVMPGLIKLIKTPDPAPRAADADPKKFITDPKSLTEIDNLFLGISKTVRQDFDKVHGKVAVNNGVPLPSYSQMEAAFKIAFQHFGFEPNEVIDISKQRLVARFAQVIMCGDKIVTDNVPFPEDSCCFTCKEFQALGNHPIESNLSDLGVSNPWEALIKYSGSYIKAKKNPNETRTDSEIIETEVSEFLRQTFLDLFRTPNVIVNGTLHEKFKSKEEFNETIDEIKNNYSNYLSDPKQLKRAVEFDEIFCKSLGISIEDKTSSFHHKNLEGYINKQINNAARGSAASFAKTLAISIKNLEGEQLKSLIDGLRNEFPKASNEELTEKAHNMMSLHLLRTLLVIGQTMGAELPGQSPMNFYGNALTVNSSTEDKFYSFAQGDSSNTVRIIGNDSVSVTFDSQISMPREDARQFLGFNLSGASMKMMRMQRRTTTTTNDPKSILNESRLESNYLENLRVSPFCVNQLKYLYQEALKIAYQQDVKL